MKAKLATLFQYVFLSIVAIFSVFPLFWMAVAATNKSMDIIRGKLIPGSHLMQNWKALLAAQDLSAAMLNSFTYATAITLLSLLVCSLAGYGFEVYYDRYKDRVMAFLLLAMMIPFAATMIPLFSMFSSMKLVSTMIAVILPTISTPFLIMFFRQSARSFPHDIIQAARIDGLNEVQIFFRMFMPTMRSTYAAAMTIVFMNAWNSYLWPKVILLDDQGFTMPMLIANLTAGYITDYGVLMLAVTICSLPTIVIFFFLQKNFAEGIVGAIK